MPLSIGKPPLVSAIVATYLGKNPGGVYQPLRIPIDEDFPVVLGVGRSRFNHIHVLDAVVAKRHCELRWSEQGIVVVHLGSPNATLVNDQRVDVHLLRVGDVITVGRHLRLHFEHVVEGPTCDGDPLMKQVLAHPEDLDLRMVVGDKLCERGDPRGELIQVQAAMDRTPLDTARRSTLERRSQELLEAYESRWISPMPTPVESWTFRFGFVDSVRVAAASDVDRVAAELRRCHPLRGVTVL